MLSNNPIIDFLVVLILVAAFLIGVASFFYMLYDATTSKIKATKKEFENKKKCEKIKFEDFKKRNTDYFWSNPTKFIWINIFFIAAIVSAILLYTISGLVIGIILFIFYIGFLFWSYNSYKEFPKIAKKKIEEFEKIIKEGIKKEIKLKDDTIKIFKDSYNNLYNLEDTILIEFPVDVTKFNYPPFESNIKNKNVISTRKLEFLVIGKDFVGVCKEATEFNLLYPKRADEKKQCEELKKAGGCKEYYYSNINHFEIDDKNLYAIMNDGTKELLISGAKVKDALKFLRDRLRVIERQKLKKIDELYKYQYIKSLEQENIINNTDSKTKEDNKS